MNTENCQISNNDIVISRRTIVKFVYVMIYLYIYALNYKRINSYFNKKADVKVQETVEEQEELKLILPQDEVLEDEEPVLSKAESVEEEFRGEQLRRLRANNPKFDGETKDEYSNRIHYMAYIEDEKEEKEKKQRAEKVELKVEEVKAEPLENDTTVWYTIEDEKARYKGEWKNGLPNGKGIKYFYKTDSYIEGNFVDSFAHGYGKQTFEKTQTWEKTVPYYEGEFNRNNYDGKGEYHFGDGDYYKGMWKNNKYHGQGAAYSKLLDKTWVGEYENDVKGEGNWVRGEI